MALNLHVKFIEAKEIASMDLGGKSDPYIKFVLIGTEQIGQTTVKNNTLTPVWNEEFHLVATNPLKQTFSIGMFDKDLASDDKMSSLDIPLSSLPAGVVIDKWYDMTPLKSSKKGGKLHLLLHLAPIGLTPFRNTLIPTGPPPHCVNVKLIEAKDVPRLDGLGKSDPFVLLAIEEETKKSKVIENTETPVWNEIFSFNLKDSSTAILKLTLKDKDVSSDDLIGTIEFAVGYLPFGYTVDQWFDFISVPGLKKKAGSVHLQLQLSFQGRQPFQ